MLVGAIPMYSVAIGGIKLRVNARDYVRAAEILKEAGYDTDEDSPSQPITQALDEAEEKIARFMDWRIVTGIIIVIGLLTGLIYYFFK